MEGNYSRWLPDRLERATGFILLDVSTFVSLTRYLRRSQAQHRPHGGLDGASEIITWGMIGHIIGPTRTNRARYRTLFDDVRLPKIYLPTPRAARRFYREAGLTTSAPHD